MALRNQELAIAEQAEHAYGALGRSVATEAYAGGVCARVDSVLATTILQPVATETEPSKLIAATSAPDPVVSEVAYRVTAKG
jgi:hypothetical protein